MPQYIKVIILLQIPVNLVMYVNFIVQRASTVLLYHKACLGYSLPNIILYILSIPGTRSFMADNKNLIEDCEGAEMVSCNKDTVGKRRLQKWSRGIFIVATAGGHIEYWQPLYK